MLMVAKKNDLDDLIQETDQLEAIKKAGETKPKQPIELQLPDALVLCVIKTKCKCGESYEGPNAHLMLRYGKNMSRPKKWISAFNFVKRETIEVHQNVLACQKCFETGWINFVEFKGEGNVTI